METDNQIARIPTSKWEPAHKALERLLEQLRLLHRTSFSLSFAVPAYEPNPYLQVSIDASGDLILECSSNVYLEPDIGRWQISQLDALGWSKPNGMNPNFNKTISSKHAVSSTARYLLTTMRMVFSLPEDVWIVFENTDLDYEIFSSSDFWHKLHVPGIVCLPGFNHLETIEGTN
jgi:hypothetical protein